VAAIAAGYRHARTVAARVEQIRVRVRPVAGTRFVRKPARRVVDERRG
jgi:hypothetical protein